MKYSSQISDYIRKNKNSIIDTLAELIEIPSVKGNPENNAPFGKYPALALDKALKICQDFGFKTENIDHYAGHADFSDEKTELAILCHLDVVPAGNDWSYPPFKLTQDNEKNLLFGRGTIDNKGPAVAVMYAMKTIKELGIPMKKNVRFIMGTDEENGSSDMQYYMQKCSMPSKVFTPDGSYPVINIEKGMIRFKLSKTFSGSSSAILSLKGGNAVNAVPGKSFCELKNISADTVRNTIENLALSVNFDVESQKNDVIKITANGTDAHASTPEKGDNAITALLKLITELKPDNSETFKYIKTLSELYPYGETDGSSCSINAHDEKSGNLTSVLSVIDFNENGFSAKNDIRFPVSFKCSDFISKMQENAGKYDFTLEILLKDEPHYTDENSSFVKSLLKVFEDITGLKGECIAIGGGTYVHNINGGVAFGAEFDGENNNMHGADEHIRIESLLLNTEIIANAIVEICGE